MRVVSEDVAKPKKTKQGVRATEVDVPLTSSKGKKSGKASGSRLQSGVSTEDVEAQASMQTTHGTEESHTLRHTEVHEEDMQDLDADERQSQSTVCIKIHYYLVMALMIFRHQWING
jgi:hypothetical protein